MSLEISTSVRVSAFVAGLFVLFLVAFNVGRIWQDEDPSYRFALSERVVDPATPITFQILDEKGEPVTGFAVRHEKPLHLVAVSQDFTGYAHLHPTMAADGTWTVPADLAPGTWRLYADFAPTGESPQVATSRLGVDGVAAEPASFPAHGEVRDGQIDGYGLTLAGDLRAGGSSELVFRITEGDVPVTDLEPYLGAYGHLVVLRQADGRYLHAHPQDGPAGPEVRFHVEVPTAGRYHLYLDFQHDGVVRTAHFALEATAAAGHHSTDPDHGEMPEMDHGNH